MGMVRPLEERIHVMRDWYSDRLKKVLQKIKTELESFSWFCSDLFKIGDGEYAIVVSRNQEHLDMNAEKDNSDFEVKAETLVYSEPETNRFGMTFRLAMSSYEGDPITFKDNLLTANFQTFMSHKDVEKEMQNLEKYDPHQIVLAAQRWVKGKLPG